jgi:two-component system chemotaxis response regulator CheY
MSHFVSFFYYNVCFQFIIITIFCFAGGLNAMKSHSKKGGCPLKILIVEDDFLGRRMLHRMLAPYGECDIAVNGKEAYEAYVNSLEEEFAYDLICLDILMPVMDGQEALRLIREVEDERGLYGDECVKVIITSALDDKRNMLTAFKTGCEGYMTKPIERREMLDKIRELGLLD